jgi:cytochrome oxidase assembly protein ShyY1
MPIGLLPPVKTLITPSRVIASLIMLSLLALCLRLGFWQLERAAEKQQITDAGAQKIRFDEAVTMAADNVDAAFWRITEVSGRYLDEMPVLLGNQTRNGKAGYQVFSRFIAAEQLFLINRGWVAIDAELTVPDTAETTVAGIVAPYRKAGMRLGPAVVSPPAQQPVVVNYPNQQEWETLYQQPLLPFTLWLAADQAQGFVREWKVQSAPPEKHLGYAFQWFAMATAVVVISLILLVRVFRSND